MRKLSKPTTCASTAVEAGPQQRHQVVVRRVVGPECEHPAGAQRPSQQRQPVGGVERRVARVQHVPRGVVDVDQQHVVRRRAAVERRARADRREEVGRDEAGPGVAGQRPRAREQAALVPADDRGQCLDDRQRGDPVVLEGGECRAPQPEPADEHVEAGARVRGQAEPGELDLGDREEARHEVLLAQPHLEHVHVEHRLAAPPQRDLAHRRRLPVELLEARAEGGLVGHAGQSRRVVAIRTFPRAKHSGLSELRRYQRMSHGCGDHRPDSPPTVTYGGVRVS